VLSTFLGIPLLVYTEFSKLLKKKIETVYDREAPKKNSAFCEMG